MNDITERASPVRYMVLRFTDRSEQYYKILDTSTEGDRQGVCTAFDLSWAHYIAKCLNEAEGFKYGP